MLTRSNAHEDWWLQTILGYIVSQRLLIKSANWVWWVYVHNPSVWEVEEGGSQVKSEDHLGYFERKQHRTRCQPEHLP